MNLALVQGAKSREVLLAWADEDLIQLVDGGNDDAFEIIVSRFKSPIINFLYRMLGDRDSAEDLTQETFIRVYRSAGRYKRIAKFSTWIYTIAANLGKNELRNRSRRHGVTWEDMQNFDLKMDCGAPMQLHSPKTDRLVEREELRAALNQAIASLPEKFKVPFVMRDVEGFAYEEIAVMLKMPKGTVKSRINRARLRFREYLEENCEEVLRFET
ncbi:MAG: sigma-70 family RNA polymerase sigma factor [Candidatus Eisenbacteria sp.]|nr:sigma-70 family RNA polymerase sigma factor [Candidatus Eisenbacteria bacterium]